MSRQIAQCIEITETLPALWRHRLPSSDRTGGDAGLRAVEDEAARQRNRDGIKRLSEVALYLLDQAPGLMSWKNGTVSVSPSKRGNTQAAFWKSR